jgi:hypothetical protein
MERTDRMPPGVGPERARLNGGEDEGVHHPRPSDDPRRGETRHALPAEKDGVRIEAAAFRTGDDGLEFCFLFTTRRAPVNVLVEDVTGGTPITLVDDPTPVLDKGAWEGIAKTRPITPAGVPWMFEDGDTTMVFRFTVTLPGRKDPTVLYQPAVYSAATKRILRSR